MGEMFFCFIEKGYGVIQTEVGKDQRGALHTTQPLHKTDFAQPAQFEKCQHIENYPPAANTFPVVHIDRLLACQQVFIDEPGHVQAAAGDQCLGG